MTGPDHSATDAVKAAHRTGQPAYLKTDDIPRELKRLFADETIERLARETGFIQRERIVHSVAFFWSLVLGFGTELQRTLAGLREGYIEMTGDEMAESSWHGRFTPALVRFLHACVLHALQQTADDAARQLGEKLQRFRDVIIYDTTVIRLHASLAKRWPATRSRVVAAGIKVGLLISAVANGPKSVTIHSERTPEIKTLRVGPWVKDHILLFDLGFYKFQLFAKIKEYGGSFVSRLKENGDPLILRSLKVHRGQAIDLAGKRWKEVKGRLTREVLDVEVEVAFRRRQYRGQQSSDTLVLRLVGIADEKTGEYHVYLTNIPSDVLTAEEVAALYRVRWEVELVFKELKSQYALDQIKTTKPYAVLGLVWTAILTLIVSRRLYSLLLRSVPRALASRYTPLRWSKVFVRTGQRLMDGMMEHIGFEKTGRGDFKRLAWFWETQALDPHVNRRRLREGWYA